MENVKEHTRERAVAIGQMLMHRGIIRHVTNTQPFIDGNYFYRFIMDDKIPKKKLDRELSETEIQKISEAMKDSQSGIKLKDRRDNFFFSYKDTFSGIEAKTWMERYLPHKDKEHAEEILQILKDKGVFYTCARKSSQFKADKELNSFAVSIYY